MAYIQYFDPRFGDYYEIYTDDITEKFESAMRSVGGAISGEKIYYSLLSELPPHARHDIEHIIWKRSHPVSSSHES
jgi:hypothetical protein